MNRQRYKLVFNRHRGQLMAVAEIASSIQHHGRTSANGAAMPDLLPSALRFSLLAVALALAMNTVAHAQILGDRNAPRNQQPTVLATPNGVPVVNIQQTSVLAYSFTGSGRFLSQKDLRIDLVASILHTGQIGASGDIDLRTAGTFANAGAVGAGGTLMLTAATIDNQASGSLVGNTLKLKATDVHTFINRGLIDGVNTVIESSTVNNLGTGRIYGDNIAIGADVLNNQAETVNGVTSAPVIAARTLAAGRDVTANAAVVAGTGDVNLAAGRNVSLGTVNENFRQQISWANDSGASNWVGTLTGPNLVDQSNGAHGISESGVNRATLTGSKDVSTQVSGNNISIRAGQDVVTKGAQIVAEGALSATAGRDVRIETANESGSARDEHQHSSGGLAKNWNGNELREDVEAQAKITQAFGQQASKLIGDYAEEQTKKAAALRTQADAATARDRDLANCVGVSSAECDKSRQLVRTAAAEYIRNSEILNTRGSYYAFQYSKTTGLAYETINGKAAGIWQSVKDMFSDFSDAVVLGYKAKDGDPEAIKQVVANSKIVVEFLSDSSNYPYLIGFMTPAQKEVFATAVENNDAKTVGKMLTDQTVAFIGTLSLAGDAAKLAQLGGIALKEAMIAGKANIGIRLNAMALDALSKSGGAFDASGNAILDMGKLSNNQKSLIGDLFGQGTVSQIIPDGKKIARIPGIGENGLDDLYKVNRPNVDYVVIEYKFVGDSKNPKRPTDLGSDRLDKTNDGLQGSTKWILGRNRIEKAVGSTEITERVYESVRNDRVESWVVTTYQNGETVIEVLDSFGKPKNVDTSKVILPKVNISGATP